MFHLLKCGVGVCDIPVMSDNRDEYTVGFMEPVEILTFIIYDVSESLIYHATPDEIFPWNTMSNDPFRISL